MRKKRMEKEETMTDNIPLPSQGQPNLGRTPAPHAHRNLSASSVVGLVFGVIAVLLSWVPIVNNFAAVLGAIGIVFAIVGVVATRSRGRKRGRGLAIAAAILSIIAIAIVLVTQSSYGKAIDSVSNEVQQSQTEQKKADEERSITMKATSNGPASVMYGGIGESHTEDFNGTWEKTMTGKEAGEYPTLSVTSTDYETPDPSGIRLSCEIIVNGKSVSRHDGSGSGANAYCDIPVDWNAGQ